MGYQSDDGKHEGWCAAVFPDGRVSTGSKNGGAKVYPVGPDGRMGTGPGDVADGRTAIGWRGHCECGWQGPLWERVATAEEQNTIDRKIWWPDLDQYGDAPADVQDAVWNEWGTHLDPNSITAVRKAAEAVREAEVRLDAAVRAARDDGRSWTEIGEAAGMRRQSAHERWAN
ncbi:hypothetical protein AB0F17_35255 [Nonomuraea sp. NPDC026600]|uniref:hypothetical protein n=1 Tax=Nonomuraea sp. NPDC026600 TaxID=3155363 RepID=UPI0034074DFD